MKAVATPDPVSRQQLEQSSGSTTNMCWTCGSCDFECPVNVATGRLHPQKLVRLANLGLVDELFGLPEIWYCLTCRRCTQTCPNTVKPAVLIDHVRRESLRKGLVSWDTFREHRYLHERFQRVRWHATFMAMQGEIEEISDELWCQWLTKPVRPTESTIRLGGLPGNGHPRFSAAVHARAAACFTCGECSSACPISCEQSAFDARSIFRMGNLGMRDELLASPWIWLCISCGRCSDVCSQRVDGRRMILDLREQALAVGAVDRGFPNRLDRAQKQVFNRFLDQLDLIFGFSQEAGGGLHCGVELAREALAA